MNDTTKAAAQLEEDILEMLRQSQKTSEQLNYEKILRQSQKISERLNSENMSINNQIEAIGKLLELQSRTIATLSAITLGQVEALRTFKTSNRTTDLEPGDVVRIKKYIGDQFNEFGVVREVYDNGDVWVTNMNMPYLGTVSARFNANEVELVEKSNND